MSVKKIVPCLDFKDGRVVKGVNFVNLKDAGDPVENAMVYEKEGADELAFLDIAASVEKRKTMVESARRVAEKINIPFTVGGGISAIEDIENLLKAGCAKVSINTAAVKNPQFVKEASARFGKERIVAAIDVKRNHDNWEVYINGGQEPTGLEAVKWAREIESLGAGEILLTSMDRDGTKDGYDIEITRKVAEAVNIPVTASGGCGKLEDFYLALTEGKAQTALAASVFHFREFSVKRVKEYLRDKGVDVRI